MIRIILLLESLVLLRKYSTKLINIIDIMKRIVFLLGMICITLGISAQTINSRSRITLKTAGEANRNVRLLLSDDFSNGWDNTWDANPAQDGGIYVFYQDAQYSIWASNEYSENLPLGFVSTSNLEYTLSFDLFLGTSYEIYDRVADQTITVNGSTADYNFTIDAADVEKAINDRFVINYDNSVFVTSVTTNAEGLATFSFASALAPVEAGVKLYKGAVNGEYLDLTQVNDIAAAQGVIVYGEPNTTYHFNAGTGTSDFTGNELIAASAWEYPHAGFDTYVLSGNALYLYEGDNFPANKAFLKIAQSGSGAPRRISFRFNGTTALENAELNEAKAVKFVENGQVFIRRGNEVFNLQGQIVK